MGQAITLLAKPITEAEINRWGSLSDVQQAIATQPLQNICIMGNQLKADIVEFEGVDCLTVGAALIHEYADQPINKLQRYDCPFGTVLNWAQPSPDENLCVEICIDWQCSEACEPNEEPDYMALQHEHPCQRQARLEYALEDMTLGGQLASASEGNRSKQFNVNFKLQCEKLERMIAKAKRECNACRGFGNNRIFQPIPRVMPRQKYKRCR